MGGSNWPGPSLGSGSTPCDRLRLDRVLEGAIPEVAGALQAGDVLDIELRDGPPKQVVAVDDKGRDAGGILSGGSLIDCLEEGHEFVAVVITVDGGAIRLEVLPRP